MVKAVSKKRKTKERFFPESVPAPSHLCTSKRLFSKHPQRWTTPGFMAYSSTRDNPHHRRVAQGRQTHYMRVFTDGTQILPPRVILHRRHITVNHVPRIKQCMELLAARSASQYVRSSVLGVTNKSSNSGDCLEEQLAILGIFTRRQTFNDPSLAFECVSPLDGLQSKGKDLRLIHRIEPYGQRPSIVRVPISLLRWHGFLYSRVSSLQFTLRPGLRY